MSDTDEWISGWIRLSATPGIGCEAARKLLQTFGLPQHIFSADFYALKQVVSDRQAKALCLPPAATTLSLIERTQLWCAEKNQAMVTLADNDYPPQLLEIPDPPPLLFVRGDLSLLPNFSVAVVGSRNATNQGVNNARQFSASLSHAGLTIVSGLALGIDAAAHQGGLEGNGSTIAVVGTGLDITYPASNRALTNQIAERGCIVSEYPLGTPPLAANFPRRNRLISGLSRGILVIEAAKQSGSLITARMATEQGRDVFAIPGSIHSPLSKGCHELIKQGAKLVETAQDILEELPAETIWQSNSVNVTEQLRISPQQCPLESTLLTAMGYDPIHPDELALLTKIECGELSAKLVMLELNGQVESLSGGLYRRLN